jgi:hypothetical protein
VAFLSKKSRGAIEFEREAAPERIVIETSHSLGAALKIFLAGAAVGAGATFFVLQKGALPTKMVGAPKQQDAVEAGLSAGGAKNERALVARLVSLAGRIKVVAGTVKGVAQFASDTVAPAVSSALTEGRRTAKEVESELQRDLEDAKRESEEAAVKIREAREKREREGGE